MIFRHHVARCNSIYIFNSGPALKSEKRVRLVSLYLIDDPIASSELVLASSGQWPILLKKLIYVLDKPALNFDGGFAKLGLSL